MFKITLFVFLIVMFNHCVLKEEMLRSEDRILIKLHHISKVVLTPLVSYIFFVVCIYKVLARYPILMHTGVHFFVGMLIIFWVMISTVKNVDPNYLNEMNGIEDLFLSPKMFYPLVYVLLGSVTFSLIEYFMFDIRIKL